MLDQGLTERSVTKSIKTRNATITQAAELPAELQVQAVADKPVRILLQQEKVELRHALFALIRPFQSSIIFSDALKEKISCLFDFKSTLNYLSLAKPKDRKRALSPEESLLVYALYKTGMGAEDICAEMERKRCSKFAPVPVRTALQDAGVAGVGYAPTQTMVASHFINNDRKYAEPSRAKGTYYSSVN